MSTFPTFHDLPAPEVPTSRDLPAPEGELRTTGTTAERDLAAVPTTPAADLRRVQVRALVVLHGAQCGRARAGARNGLGSCARRRCRDGRLLGRP